MGRGAGCIARCHELNSRRIPRSSGVPNPCLIIATSSQNLPRTWTDHHAVGPGTVGHKLMGPEPCERSDGSVSQQHLVRRSNDTGIRKRCVLFDLRFPTLPVEPTKLETQWNMG